MSAQGPTTLPDVSESMWRRRSEPPVSRTETLPSSTDVCVIGAGIAGLSVAAQLVTAGVGVTVIDAGDVGAGVTGHSTAKVTILQDLAARQIERRDGEAMALDYVRANRFGLDWVAAQVESAEIDCALTRRPALTYVTERSHIDRVEAEARLLRRAGEDASVVETGLPYPTAGAVRLGDQGQLDPVALTHGLARLVVDGGATVVPRVRAVDVDDGGGGATVITDAGKITARWVVLATALPFMDRGLFFARSAARSSHVVVCEVDRTPPEGMYLSDDGPTRSLRTATSADGAEVLLVGGEGHSTGQGGDTLERQRSLADWADEYFGVRRVTHRYMAEDYTTPDRRPFAGRLVPGPSSLLTLTGFNKWGFANAPAAAAVLASIVTDRPAPDWAQVYSTTRVPVRGLPGLVSSGVDVGVHYVKGWARPFLPARSEGPRVRRRGVRPVADSTAVDGTPCAVSGICPHLGGVVAWNPAAGTWDCPLHGSRFDRDGVMVHGPSTDDLAPASG